MFSRVLEFCIAVEEAVLFPWPSTPTFSPAVMHSGSGLHTGQLLYDQAKDGVVDIVWTLPENGVHLISVSKVTVRFPSNGAGMGR